MASSKMVNDRRRSAVVVAEAASTHGEAVGQKLGRIMQRLHKGADGGAPPVPWASVLQELGRSILARSDELVAADIVHLAEKADDAEPRQRRDQARATLYQRLVTVRAALHVTYGEVALHRLGFTGATPQEPIALHRLGLTVIERLPALAGLVPVMPGITLDMTPHAQALAADVAALDLALRDVVRESRELDATQVRKDEVIQAHDTHFLHAARALEALFALAGEHALAARVRPSVQRPGRTHQEVPDDAEDGLDGDAGGSPDGNGEGGAGEADTGATSPGLAAGEASA